MESGTTGYVTALSRFNDGDGPALYATGRFHGAGGQAVFGVAKWDGSAWSALGFGMVGSQYGPAQALAVYDDGHGPALFVAGEFERAGLIDSNGIAKWDGSNWSPLGGGMNGSVSALAVFNDGRGPALYVGGDFTAAGVVVARHIVRWDGSDWSPVGGGLMGWWGWEGSYWGNVRALTIFDDGSGTALYAGGNFESAGAHIANDIARWDGVSWSPMGDGLNGGAEALTVFDDGTGPALYAGGHFNTAGGVPADYIAKWNGTSWAPLDTGVAKEPHVAAVLVLNAFDDGTGAALYVGGRFTTAGNASAYYIAKWDGTAWSPLGGGVSGGGYNYISALAVFDDGTGPALYVGGRFTAAGGVFAKNIARWDGSSWFALGDGMDTPVGDMVVFNDGGGSRLFVVGNLGGLGAPTGYGIATWDGSAWSRPDTTSSVGLDDPVEVLAAFTEDNRPALYMGGSFAWAGTTPSARIAKWFTEITGDADADNDVNLFDYSAFHECVASRDKPGDDACRCLFDFDWDANLDLIDFSAMQRAFARP